MVAVIYCDIQTQNPNRQAIEVRIATPVEMSGKENSAFAAFAEDTIYSCAYSTELERDLALRRVDAFLRQLRPHYAYVETNPEMHAVWQ